MTNLHYVVLMTTCFAEAAAILNAECTDGLVQQYVYCSGSSGWSKVVACSVEGIATITSIRIDWNNSTNCIGAVLSSFMEITKRLCGLLVDAASYSRSVASQ